MAIEIQKIIGSLVSQITESRAQSDFTSAQIAKLYAKDELLSKFPIARFRTPEIEITIPVIIDAIEESEPITSDFIDNKDFNSRTYHILKDTAKKETFDRKTSTALQKVIAKESAVLELNLKSEKKRKQAMQLFSQAVSTKFSKLTNPEDTKLTKKIELQLSKKLIKQISTSEKTQKSGITKVIAEASKLREYDSRYITQIKVKLNEEGMEWHKELDELGNEKSMLLPE